MKKYLIIFILIISKFNLLESSENIKYFDDQIKKLETKYESDSKKIKAFENYEKEEILAFIGNIKQAKEFFLSTQSLKAKKEMAFLQLTLKPKEFDGWTLNEEYFENYNLFNSHYEDSKRGYLIVCNDLNPNASKSSDLYHLTSISIEFLNASMQDEGDAKLGVVFGNLDANDERYAEFSMFYKAYENNFVFYSSRDDVSDLFLINRKNFQIEVNPNSEVNIGHGKTNCFAGHKTDKLFFNSNNESNIKEFLINNYYYIQNNLDKVIPDIVEKIENNFYLEEYQNKLNNLSLQTKNNLANLNSKFEKEKLIFSERKKEIELEEKIKTEEMKRKAEEERIRLAEAQRLLEEEQKRIAEERIKEIEKELKEIEKEIKETEKGKNNQIKKNLAMIQSAACQNFHTFVDTKFSRIQVNFFGDLKSQLETLVREKDIIFGDWIIFSGAYYDIPEEPFIVCGIPLHEQYKQFENSLNQHGIMVARWLEGYGNKGN